MRGLAEDLLNAVKALARAKGFAAAAVATSALGIGLNLTVFTAVDRMLFRPLPYANPDRLVLISSDTIALARTLRPVLLGVGLGCLAGWWAGQFIQSLLFEVDAHEPRVYLLIAVILVLTAIVSGWLPARRASRTDPIAVLRAQ